MRKLLLLCILVSFGCGQPKAKYYGEPIKNIKINVFIANETDDGKIINRKIGWEYIRTLNNEPSVTNDHLELVTFYRSPDKELEESNKISKEFFNKEFPSDKRYSIGLKFKDPEYLRKLTSVQGRKLVVYLNNKEFDVLVVSGEYKHGFITVGVKTKAEIEKSIK